MIIIADAIFMMWLLLIERAVPRARLTTLALQAAIGAIVALAIVAPFARHYGVLAAVGPDEAVRGSADAAAYLVPPENTFAGQWLMAHGVNGPRWNWGEQTLYLGWTALLLAERGIEVALIAAASARPFALIASSASSHETRRHWPFSSFIGVFRRRSPLVVSRAAAPLAQWPPRLIGDSNAAS